MMTVNTETTKKDLETLSFEKLEGLKLFLAFGLHNQVRSDSGYVLEFALKAAICKEIGVTIYPNQKDYKVHNLNSLIKFANLNDELKKEKYKKEFFDNWSLLSKWNVHLRYKTIGKDEQKVAQQYYDAVAKEGEGVFPWVQKFW